MAKAKVVRGEGMLPADALVIEAVEDERGRWRVYSRAHGHLLFGGHATRAPFLDAARELLRLGAAPSTMLALVDELGRIRLSARLSYAAGWTVAEGDKVGPRLAPWKERPPGSWATQSDRGDDKSP